MDEEKLNTGVYEGDYNVLLIPFFLRQNYFDTLLSFANTNVNNKKYTKYVSNIYNFSTAKAQTQVLELQQILNLKLDKAGFDLEAKKINSKHLEWLRTESEQVELVSDAALNWEDITSDKEVKYLKYVTFGDDRVRPQHAAWNNIIKPVNDPFWDTRYPPNGWACRCNVEPLRKGKSTDLNKKLKEFNDTSKIKIPSLSNPDKDFSYNWGKVDFIFDKSHPYFKTARKYKKVRFDRN
jgi:SPP1 gp7 family putative phage head morphogenesis protein